MGWGVASGNKPEDDCDRVCRRIDAGLCPVRRWSPGWSGRGRSSRGARMRKYGVVLALVVVSVAVWVASASAISSPQVFSLLAVDNGKAQPINGFMFQRAPAAGDQFVISEDLYKWAGTKRGAKVGSDIGVA